MCAPWDTGCIGAEVATAAATGVLGQISQMIVAAEQYLVDVSASWWVLVPSIKLYPNAGNTDPYAAPIDSVARIRALMLPIAAIIAAGGMLWNGLLMVLSRKPAPLVNVLRGLWNTALWSAIGVFGTNLLLYGTDRFSAYVITSALDSVGEPSFAKRLSTLIVPVVGAAGIPPGLVMLVGTIAMICAFIQAILMLFRDGSVLLLAGSTALAGSGGFTNATSGWLPLLLKWQLALIFYKPVAAIVYASAIWMQGENRSSDPRVLLMGIAMMIVAVVALPVLLRFFNWTIGGLQTGGGGLGVLAAAGAGGLHAASSLRAAGGFGPGEHARYLAETFDRGSSSGPGPTSTGTGSGPGRSAGPGLGPGPGPGPGPNSSSGPDSGSGTTPSPEFRPVFQGQAGAGKVATVTSAGVPAGATGTASGMTGAAAGAGETASGTGAVAASSGSAGAGTSTAVTAATSTAVTAATSTAATGTAASSTAATGAAATGPAAPVVAGAVVVTSAAAKAAKGAANTTANAISDAAKGQ